MTTKTRRATRRHRCARCGHEKTYENAGAAEARYWFSKHSCRKHEEATLRTTLHEERLAAVDRAPKPCLHKMADHQHGTRACYVLDRCRCWPCAKANTAAEGERTRLKAYGRYNKYVAAEHVRAHLTELRAYGIGLKKVSEISGVSNGSLTKIWYGVYADTGLGHERRHGQGQLVREPARRVLRTTAERIFAVEAVPANLGPRQADRERTPAARLHLRALVALGWSMSKLAVRIGWTPANFCRMVASDAPIGRGTVDKIEAVYAELSMALPPESTWHEKSAASRSRNYAKTRDWLPPLALDEDGDTVLDSTDAYLDEAAIYRRMHGDKSVRLTKDEAAEVVRRWAASGRTLADCERTTGIKPERWFRFSDQGEAS